MKELISNWTIAIVLLVFSCGTYAGVLEDLESQVIPEDKNLVIDTTKKPSTLPLSNPQVPFLYPNLLPNANNTNGTIPFGNGTLEGNSTLSGNGTRPVCSNSFQFLTNRTILILNAFIHY